MLINNDAIIATLPNSNCILQFTSHNTLEMSTIIIAISCGIASELAKELKIMNSTIQTLMVW